MLPPILSQNSATFGNYSKKIYAEKKKKNLQLCFVLLNNLSKLPISSEICLKKSVVYIFECVYILSTCLKYSLYAFLDQIHIISNKSFL